LSQIRRGSGMRKQAVSTLALAGHRRHI
jgi:hypothetical protein